MGISPTLNIPQARFLAMQHKFKAYVAGFGSGKTWVGCGGICKGMWEHPKINQGYFAPTYPQIRDIFYPTIEEVAFDWGLNVKINEGNKEVHFYEGRRYRGTTICRSMEKPGSIVGFKIGNAMVDELDVMAAAKAQQAWRKIIARMRYKIDGLRNGIDVTTTPEGFKFVYPWWENEYPDNLYQDCWYECGFREFDGPPKPGDMVIMQVQADKWNHAGILLEGNMLLHHLYGHLSQRVPYGGYWQERTMKIVRHLSMNV
ncbi:TPA: terminase family protein [Enterobacter hormaechei subsp. xiangfangensis]